MTGQQKSFSDLMKCNKQWKEKKKEKKKSCTHLDLDILAVNHLHDAHNVIKHQAHFLTVVCRRKINKYI